MTHDWVYPISEDDAPHARLHLVPSAGGPLVYAACGKMVNLQFTTQRPGVKQCAYCQSALARIAA